MELNPLARAVSTVALAATAFFTLAAFLQLPVDAVLAIHWNINGVADGFAGGGIGDGLEGERGEFAAGHGDELERLSFDADEIFGVAVENPSGEFTGGGVAEEFEVVSVFADFHEGAAVRGGVGV